MSPPAATAAPQNAGVSTSASGAVEAMIRVVAKAFADADITMSPSRTSRLVRRCLDRAKRNNVSFRDSLAEANLSSTQRRRVFADPDLARCIAYCDPVGERATESVRRTDPDGRRARTRAAHIEEARSHQ